jgi:hypothetical protein
MLANSKTQATGDQIETKESKIIEFKKREYLAHHILISTTSTRLATKIKGLLTLEDMYKAVKDDTTSKSTLFLLDVKDQLLSMKLTDNNDPKTHLAELKTHFQLMMQCQDNLMKMGSVMSDMQFNTIIMFLFPELYWLTLQMITAAE